MPILITKNTDRGLDCSSSRTKMLQAMRKYRGLLEGWRKSELIKEEEIGQRVEKDDMKQKMMKDLILNQSSTEIRASKITVREMRKTVTIY